MPIQERDVWPGRCSQHSGVGTGGGGRSPGDGGGRHKVVTNIVDGMGGRGRDRTADAGGAGGEEPCFGPVDAQAGGLRERVDDREERKKVLEAAGSEREVVRGTGHPGLGGGTIFEKGDEDVVDEDKDDGGEGAPLLHPFEEGNARVWGEGRYEGCVVEQVGYGVEKPEGEPLLTQDRMDVVMVHRVEGLDVVEEKEEEIVILVYGGVEQIVEHPDVVGHVSPGEEHLLGGVDQVLDGAEDA